VGKAMVAGVNFFDTAESYSYGWAEEILGKALGNKQKQAIVTTKVIPFRMMGPNEGGLSRHHVIEACHASLKRLGTDYLDLYQLHGFDPETPLEETLRALDDLVRQGKVRYIGCSNFMGWKLARALWISDKNGWEKFTAIEILYSLLARGVEFELVPLCLDQGIGILTWSPLHMGFLTGKFRRGQPFPKGTRLADPDFLLRLPFDEGKGYDIVEELDRIAREHNATVSQAALNHLLCRPGVTSVLIGFRTLEQLDENLKAIQWNLTKEEVARLDKVSEPSRPYPYYALPDLKP